MRMISNILEVFAREFEDARRPTAAHWMREAIREIEGVRKIAEQAAAAERRHAETHTISTSANNKES